jgi:uncharacterized protein (TIGR03083 family)
VLQREVDAFFDLVADPDRWEAPTACAGWEVRDVVGHMVDAIEGYFPGWEATRTGAALPEPLGLRAMAARIDANAKAFRAVSRTELLARLREDVDRLLAEFRRLDADAWTGLMVSHPYMGPLPAMFYPVFQLVDFAVHGWDIREGTGAPHALAGDSADLLVPLIFVLWQATADTSAVAAPFSFGVRVSGANAGDTRVDVGPDGVTIAPGSLDDVDAILECDPAGFVLTGYGRINGGTVRGDASAVTRFRNVFFAV